MNINPTNTGSLPFQLANAYNVRPPTSIRPIQPVAAPRQTDPQNVGGDTNQNLARITRLVAGAVPGKIDFSGPTPKHNGSLPFYSHPADNNSAATNIRIGRVVDLQG